MGHYDLCNKHSGACGCLTADGTPLYPERHPDWRPPRRDPNAPDAWELLRRGIAHGTHKLPEPMKIGLREAARPVKKLHKPCEVCRATDGLCAKDKRFIKLAKEAPRGRKGR